MSRHRIHIVSFDIPYPPVYGGVIDVFYKVKALSETGAEVVLHCFFKDGIRRPAELEAFCREVHYYPRRMSWRNAVGTTPFIVASRSHQDLKERIRSDEGPVILEGMHTMALLGDPALKGRRILLRMHNLEWTYYSELAAAETSLWKRLFFHMESWRLLQASDRMRKANGLLAISEFERKQLAARFKNCHYLPPFNGHTEMRAPAGFGSYALYHGNLSVAENRNAVEFLLNEVFSGIDYPLKVAGSGAPSEWVRRIRDKRDVGLEVIEDPDNAELEALVSGAHVHVLPAFQPTGVKLKLLHALFNGRHCVVTPEMVEGSSLAGLCHVAGNTDAFRKSVLDLVPLELSVREIELRRNILLSEFNDAVNAERLIRWLFPGR